jgi:hypothetical protein
MKGITAAIASKIPAGALWSSKADAPPQATIDLIPSPYEDADLAEVSDDTSADLAELIKRHDDVVAAEQQSFNDRLSSLLNTRRELPANDRRRLNALLAELLEHRDDAPTQDVTAPAQDVAAPAQQDVAAPAQQDVVAPAQDAVAPAQDVAESTQDIPAPAPEDVPATVTAAFDQAMDGIVKSLNEHFAANVTSSIVSAPSADVQVNAEAEPHNA